MKTFTANRGGVARPSPALCTRLHQLESTKICEKSIPTLISSLLYAAAVNFRIVLHESELIVNRLKSNVLRRKK